MTNRLEDAAAWNALLQRREQMRGFSLREAFTHDPRRAGRMRLQAAGLTLDYSKSLVDADTLELLLALADERGVGASVRRQFGGEQMNTTERRAVLHTALRGSDAGTTLPEAQAVRAVRERMAAIATRLRDREWTGWSGRAVSDVVNIGIGGSHLGPAFVTAALGHLCGTDVRCHFVSNVDPCDLEGVLRALDPATTLFIVASKSFSTLETLQNALAAQRWLADAGCPGDAFGKHFLAVSSNVPAATAFGIAEDNVLPMWDWVGGRYSLWSAIGLPIAIAVGADAFDELLQGACAMDAHFLGTPAHANMPLILALLDIWHRNMLGCGSLAVIPYDQGLTRLPEYLQQLVMESNGKSVAVNGEALGQGSAGVVWGAAGTNGQHSFHQMLHQGTDIVPVDFVLPLRSYSGNTAQHAYLVANCIAQSQALMLGRTLAEARAELAARGVSPQEAVRLAPHLVMPGNRPSNTIVMERVTPRTLGALIALYEHRTVAAGYLWGLNSFDQFGVELGKRLGEAVHAALLERGAEVQGVDSSTAALIVMYRQMQLQAGH
ncbi:MAG TPA: glucose-6-phosphate isomerase [Pseudomonadales bacterium]|nr:glucose-6-phosphate isomerase [Pseudomonadales bacterium]